MPCRAGIEELSSLCPWDLLNPSDFDINAPSDRLIALKGTVRCVKNEIKAAVSKNPHAHSTYAKFSEIGAESNT
jgi:hypothetical protein